MSIDIDILPTIAAIPTWRIIRCGLLDNVKLSRHILLDASSRVIDMETKAPLCDEEVPALGRSYRLELPIRNTLVVTLMPSAGNLEELEYLGDYGRNLDAASVQQLAGRWRNAGYYWELSTMAGRSPAEPQLFVALAVSLADACKGHVVVMNEGIFDLGVGVYSAKQFQHAKPQF